MRQTISVRETAAKLGCTLKYVYDLLYAGKLLAEKCGRQWRISAAAVEAHLRNREARNGGGA